MAVHFFYSKLFDNVFEIKQSSTIIPVESIQYINSFMTDFHISKKPLYWFALQGGTLKLVNPKHKD